MAVVPPADPGSPMNIFKELFAKLHIAREHMTSEYRIQKRLDALEDKLLLLMDNSLDITKIKPATGRARLRQEIQVQILRIVDAVATKNDIPYWLDFGTLLGAVRHHGFIPWDGDVDISMPRDAMNRFLALQDNLPDSIFVTTDTNQNKESDLVLRVCEKRSLIRIDIFPYDFIKGALSSSGNETEWAKAYIKAFDVANMERRHGVAVFRDNWLASHPSGDGDVDALVVGLDYAGATPNYRNIYDVRTIFPLHRVEFEGCHLNVPADSESCLWQTYGDYMRFPKDLGNPKYVPIDPVVSTEEMRTVLDKLTKEVNELYH